MRIIKIGEDATETDIRELLGQMKLMTSEYKEVSLVSTAMKISIFTLKKIEKIFAGTKK